MGNQHLKPMTNLLTLSRFWRRNNFDFEPQHNLSNVSNRKRILIKSNSIISIER